MKRFSIKSVLVLIATVAIISGVVLSAIRPFQPSLKFENVHVTSADHGNGTSTIAINGTLRNTGREWLRFLARHTTVSGYYTTSVEPNARLWFESGSIADYFDAGIGPAESMPLTNTILIPHSRLQRVSVRVSMHVAAGHAEPGSERDGWAHSQTYYIDEP